MNRLDGIHLQVKLYAAILRSKSVTSLLTSAASNPGDSALSVITQLRKLCNHPDLLLPTNFDGTLLPRSQDDHAVLMSRLLPRRLADLTVSNRRLHVVQCSQASC